MGWSVSGQMDFNREFFSPEAITQREAMKQAGKVQLQGTYAQRAADEERMKGNFAQNIAQDRLMRGTFGQNADLKREVEGTYAQRHMGELEKLGQQGAQRMDELAYQFGPGSLEERKFGLEGEIRRAGAANDTRQLDILGDTKETGKKTAIMTALANARENAVKFFPEDPAKAEAYYQREAKGIYRMFPDQSAPVIEGDKEGLRMGGAAPAGATAKAPANATRAIDPTEVVDRYRTTMNTMKDPSRFMTLHSPSALTPPAVGPTGDLFPAGRPKPPAVVPAPIDPSMELFPGGRPRNIIPAAPMAPIRRAIPGVNTVGQPSVRRAIPSPVTLGTPGQRRVGAIPGRDEDPYIGF